MEIHTYFKKISFLQQNPNIHGCSRKLFSSLTFLIGLLLFLSINQPLLAGTDDWVQVDRFKRQLSAAEDGKLKAMYAVGKLYERGRGVNKNYALAVSWYQKAASAGQTSAQSRLGIMYFEGRGVKKNYTKALKLLNAAAKNKVPSAQYQLANMYELGAGVSQNLSKAIHWYKQSDKSGYYLAKAKVTRLTKLLKSGGTIQRKTGQSVATAKKPNSKLIQMITGSQWFKRKKPVGYLPSNITNCVKDTYNTMHCISTSQERSTGEEIITYNTESVITVRGKSSFNIIYTNNVLDVATFAAEDGDGEVIEQTASRIKKGKQGKKRKLKCRIKNENLIECSKGSSTFNITSR